MSKVKKTIVRALTVLLVAAAVVMMPLPGHESVQAASVKLNRTSASLKVGKTLKLKLKNARASKVKWSSSNKKVAVVNSSGKIKAKKAGKATITAKYKGKKYRCKITVKSSGYSNKQLCSMAIKYYCKYNPNCTAKINAVVEYVKGSQVTIWVYAVMPEHNATVAYYTVSRKTGKGTDEVFYENVDLTDVLE